VRPPDTVVTGWAATTLTSAAGVWLLAHRRKLSDQSWIAVRIAGGAVMATLVVLVFAGVVWAAGGDPGGYCGGG
jgi:hypothetical protein